MADNKHDQATTLTRRTAMQAGALLASGVPLFWSGEVRADKGADKAKVDAVLNGAVSSGNVPGVVALAADDKGVIYEGAFGKRNLMTGAAMTPDTMFWIASMTKAVTSTAAMQMVEQGKLSLDKPISDVVLELSATQVLEGFDAAGAPKLRPPKRPITLRHLLTHTAGFSYDLWNKDIERYMKVANIPGVGTCKNEALKTPLIADPGDKWEYGINIDWAGKAVERVSGLSLDGYMRERIFTPLGMKDTVFILKPDQQARVASVYARGADGKLAPIEFSMPQAPEFFMGGGDLHSTGRDYLTFLRMLLAGGKLNNAQILKPNRRPDEQEQHGRRERHAAQDHPARPDQRCRVLPRHGQEMGPGLHDQHPGRARPAQRGQPGVGRLGQYLLLARPEEEGRRRHPDPDPALRRPEGPAAAGRLRKCRLQERPRRIDSLRRARR
jgi:methyl acetate hydrolase